MSGNPIPAEKRSEHLFLLVGTNPLPNWVAAKLLTRQNGHIHLVYTAGVKHQMQRLKTLIEADHSIGIRVEYFETEEASEARIFADVRRQAEKIERAGKRSVGLNYTGGTKMMSVHAHRALKAVFKDPAPTLSYLDARTLKLKFDGALDDGYDISLSPVVQIDIDTLCRLHDAYDNTNTLPYQKAAKYPQAAHGLVNVNSISSGQSTWREWCNKKPNLDEIGRDVERNLTSRQRAVKKFNEKTLPTEIEFSKRVESDLTRPQSKSYSPQAIKSILERVLGGYQELLTELQVSGGEPLLLVGQRNPGFRDSLDVARWMDGMWLEHYTFSQIESCRAAADINPSGLALNLSAINDEGREFEADVLALRGYQLFYISCYTGSKFGTAKLKLFEAMLRAAQIGGDEARFALVSCVDQQADLRRQVEANWQKTGQVEVFGRDSLPRLADKLKEWFTLKM